MTPPWPCSQCGAPGFRNVYARGYCPTHLSQLYARFDPDIWDGQGIAVQAGGHRPDHGPEYYDVTCTLCHATWVGRLLDDCTWCQDARARDLIWQAELTLTPPDVDPDDTLYDTRMAAWGERVARAVDAGIVTPEAAQKALTA